MLVSNIAMAISVSTEFTTAGQHTWTVPNGVKEVTATVVGGTSYYSNGIELVTTFPVTEGQVYYMFVAGNGESDGTGGFNGGGSGNGGGYGGGGATDIRTSPNDLNSRIVVAGGSGGSACDCYACLGGDSGCAGVSASAGTANADEAGSSGGQGGTQSAGGAGGYYNAASYSGASGSLGAGGAAAVNTFAAGGGGGGGFYGGGGGSGTAGGGGSSYSIFPSRCYSASYIPGVYLTWAVEYTITFEYTGGMQYFEVPTDVTWVTVNASGAQGGSTSMGQGGLGSFMSVNTSLAMPFVFSGGFGFQVNVGGQGGYGGGALGGCPDAGNGGGASEFSLHISASNPPVTTTIVYAYAAGGGGAGSADFCPASTCGASSINGGAGGLAVGATGSSNPFDGTSTGGTGGSQTAGGSGGQYSSYPAGLSGIAGNGGNGGAGTCGGGGGGGYYGGGGGCYTGGGGGSSYSEAQVLTEQSGVRAGNGVISITFRSAVYFPPTDDDDNDGKEKEELSAGAIAGIVIGVVIGVLIIGWCVTQKKDTPHFTPPSPVFRPSPQPVPEPWVAMPKSQFDRMAANNRA